MKLINRLKTEIRVIKWPTKKEVRKQFIVILVSSTVLMLGISLIEFLTNSVLNMIL